MIHDYAAISRIVKEVIEKNVSTLQVVRVNVRPQRPDDPPDELDIMVILNGERDPNVRRQLVRSISDVRSRLETEIRETAFPVFYFVSEDDEGLKEHAAASFDSDGA